MEKGSPTVEKSTGERIPFLERSCWVRDKIRKDLVLQDFVKSDRVVQRESVFWVPSVVYRLQKVTHLLDHLFIMFERWKV